MQHEAHTLSSASPSALDWVVNSRQQPTCAPSTAALNFSRRTLSSAACWSTTDSTPLHTKAMNLFSICFSATPFWKSDLAMMDARAETTSVKSKRTLFLVGSGTRSQSASWVDGGGIACWGIAGAGGTSGRMLAAWDLAEQGNCEASAVPASSSRLAAGLMVSAWSRASRPRGAAWLAAKGSALSTPVSLGMPAGAASGLEVLLVFVAKACWRDSDVALD
ncbi:MAG: hypothetical protein FRX49_09903 [Trebouxia sp. A1-2]|nr:MAG: hypothetical protein FRX49_09903 [Trebouxia sp. A1-2]